MSDSGRNAEGTDHNCGLFKRSQMKKRVLPPRSRCHVAAVAVVGLGGGEIPMGPWEERSESGGLLRGDGGSHRSGGPYFLRRVKTAGQERAAAHCPAWRRGNNGDNEPGTKPGFPPPADGAAGIKDGGRRRRGVCSGVLIQSGSVERAAAAASLNKLTPPPPIRPHHSASVQ